MHNNVCMDIWTSCNIHVGHKNNKRGILINGLSVLLCQTKSWIQASLLLPIIVSTFVPKHYDAKSRNVCRSKGNVIHGIVLVLSFFTVLVIPIRLRSATTSGLSV